MFKKTVHYRHLLLNTQPEPMAIFGASSSGKSILGEDILEEYEDNKKNALSVLVYDAGDEIESGFAIFPAVDKQQLKCLVEQDEKPEAKNVKLYIIYSKKGLKEWMNYNKKRFGDKKLPEAEIVTISLKNLKREDIQFLIETNEAKKPVTLFLKAIDNLKDDEGINELKEYLSEFSTTKKIKYLGKALDIEDESVADKGDYRDCVGSLEMFEEDGFLMPQNFYLNLNMKKVLSEPNTRHIFVYKALKDDKKLRHFVVFHILNEIDRYAHLSIHWTNVVIEEAQTLTPFKGKGYFAVMEQNIGDMIGRLRKRGVGFVPIFVSRVWSDTAEKVRSECRRQYIFKIEQDDMLKFIKARSLGKKGKDKMDRLKTGECIFKGYEHLKIGVNVPKHGHKHHYMNFETEYRKFFKDKLKDYTEVIEEVEKQRKSRDKSYEVRKKRRISDSKRSIVREQERRMQKEKGFEELKQMKEEAKKQRDSDRKKRDEEIVQIYEELKLQGEKVSSRKIAKVLSERGIKCSYKTVQNICKDKGKDLSV